MTLVELTQNEEIVVNWLKAYAAGAVTEQDTAKKLQEHAETVHALFSEVEIKKAGENTRVWKINRGQQCVKLFATRAGPLINACWTESYNLLAETDRISNPTRGGSLFNDLYREYSLSIVGNSIRDLVARPDEFTPEADEFVAKMLALEKKASKGKDVTKKKEELEDKKASVFASLQVAFLSKLHEKLTNQTKELDTIRDIHQHIARVYTLGGGQKDGSRLSTNIFFLRIVNPILAVGNSNLDKIINDETAIIKEKDREKLNIPFRRYKIWLEVIQKSVNYYLEKKTLNPDVKNWFEKIEQLLI